MITTTVGHTHIVNDIDQIRNHLESPDFQRGLSLLCRVEHTIEIRVVPKVFGIPVMITGDQ